jgi:flagellar motor switch protein FliN/FliY
MASITESSVEGILSACATNIVPICESLNQCFDLPLRLGTGDSLPWSEAEIPPEFDGPGIASILDVGGESVICLVPLSLPIPDWYTSPNEGQANRLQTLAMEWSMSMLPPELEAESFRTITCDNLKQSLITGSPTEWSAMMVFPVFRTSANEGDPPVSKILIVAPLTTAAALRSDVAAPDLAAQSSDVEAHDLEGDFEPPQMPTDYRPRLLLPMPVTISVRLADKKIEMGQLLNIAPGTLITFNKSCEDLLDMYVNNRRYCRGEAVKIGEKFGLKVNEVATEDVRESHVMY